jgi:hypothetical protein
MSANYMESEREKVLDTFFLYARGGDFFVCFAGDRNLLSLLGIMFWFEAKKYTQKLYFSCTFLLAERELVAS